MHAAYTAALTWRQRLALAAILTIPLGGAGALGAGAWFVHANSAPPSAPASVASEPAIDEATLAACDHAALANTPGIEFEVSIREARAARDAAGYSHVSALLEIALKYRGDKDRSPADDAYAFAAGYAVSTWCIRNNLAS
jgi:hypothetical protein